MWTPRAADRRGLRYPSDLTDAKWWLIEGFVPARHGGRKREANVREMVKASAGRRDARRFFVRQIGRIPLGFLFDVGDSTTIRWVPHLQRESFPKS